MTVYAKFLYPENGYTSDVEKSKELGLIVGRLYEVTQIELSGYSTSVMIFGCWLNSVQFEFFHEDGTECNIYSRNSNYF